MNDSEKINRIKKLVEEIYKNDFDFEIEHWMNGNIDDSYEYGFESGKQDLIRTIKKIIDET